MRKFIIERDVPGIGALQADGLKEAAQQSNRALAQVGPGVQWLETYVTADKTFCVYLAENEDLIREHARCSGFPANRITEVTAIMDPSTGHV